MSRHTSTARTATVLLLTLVSCACDEDETVVVFDPENQPPLIVTQGDVPAGPLVDVRSGPPIWVLVGDPDGLEDITAVFLDVQTLRVHSLILRPTTPAGGCVTLVYNSGEVVDPSAIPLPVEVEGPRRVRMSVEQGGIYGHVSYPIPQLDQVMSDFFESHTGCASGGADYLDILLLLPPAAPIATEVFLTRLDLEYLGVTVTAYDAAGSFATTAFPDLRITFSTAEEANTPP